MASVNKVILIGNLGRDPETRYMPDGNAITNISLACNESWTDKASGEKKERVEWVRVSFFARLAEVAGEYLKKGSQCYVEGSLRTRKWQDKDGNDRYTTEVRADRLVMLGSKPSDDTRTDNAARDSADTEADRTRAAAKPAAAKKPAGKFDDMEDSVPF